MAQELTRNQATKETTCFIHFKSNTVEAAGISVAQASCFADRIHKAFEMGEPVWMIAEELKLRASAPKSMKTPRQMAVRVVSA